MQTLVKNSNGDIILTLTEKDYYVLTLIFKTLDLEKVGVLMREMDSNTKANGEILLTIKYLYSNKMFNEEDDKITYENITCNKYDDEVAYAQIELTQHEFEILTLLFGEASPMLLMKTIVNREIDFKDFFVNGTLENAINITKEFIYFFKSTDKFYSSALDNIYKVRNINKLEDFSSAITISENILNSIK